MASNATRRTSMEPADIQRYPLTVEAVDQASHGVQSTLSSPPDTPYEGSIYGKKRLLSAADNLNSRSPSCRLQRRKLRGGSIPTTQETASILDLFLEVEINSLELELDEANKEAQNSLWKLELHIRDNELLYLYLPDIDFDVKGCHRMVKDWVLRISEERQKIDDDIERSGKKRMDLMLRIAEQRKDYVKLFFGHTRSSDLGQDTGTYDRLPQASMSYSPHRIKVGSTTSSYKRKVLRCLVAGSECLARPDSGSDRDIITDTFAEEHGIPVQRSDNDKSFFRLGTGKLIKSVGRALVPLSVVGDGQSTGHRWFDVLAQCPVPLILGLNFIRTFKLFTKNKHLLVDSPYKFGDLPVLKWIGSPQEQINFVADGEELVAGADTGSDLDLMSLRCARKRGYKIDTSESARTRVMLADETVVETVGEVLVSSVQLSNFDTFEMIFHVLPGLPCDVIFGEEFLEQMDAFNTCDMVHLDDNVIQSLNTLINLGPIQALLTFRRPSKPKHTAQQEHDQIIEAEIYRRNKANRALAKIKDEAQAATASALEEATRRYFNTRHSRCLHCIGGVVARDDQPVDSSTLGSPA